MIDSEPDKIVLHHGTNDLSTKSSLSHFQPQQKLVTTMFSFQLLPKEMIIGTAKKEKVLCKCANIPYIDDNNVTSNAQLQRSGSK